MQRSEPFRTLLIEDDDAIRRLTRTSLERDDGFEVVAEAADGASALQQATMHHPDVILLDADMPVTDGLLVLPSLRAAVPSATVVVLSGDGEVDHAAIRALGAADVLTKDGDWEGLGRSLRAIVDRRSGTSAQQRMAARLVGRDDIGLWKCAVCGTSHDAATSWILVEPQRREARVACPPCVGATTTA